MTKIFFTLIFIAFGVVLSVNRAEAAVLSITPAYEELSLGETFIADIRLNSENQVINAVKATITYPTSLLEVVEVSAGGSFLTLWAEEPAVESSAGVITLSGGIPNGSYVADGRVAAITFRAKSPGAGEVEFDAASTSVHLNDGQGTPVPLTFTPGVYQVKETQAVKIFSSTHPNENAWYTGKTLTVNWSVEGGASYSYVLSLDAKAQPEKKSQGAVDAVSFPDLSDGVYYFILSRKLPDKDWAVIGKRRTMIDSQPPLPIKASIAREKTLYEGKYFLIFSTVDKTSGIDHYDIEEGGKTFMNAKSPYVLKDQALQASIIIRAFDRAGNSIEYSFPGAAKKNATASFSGTLLLFFTILAFGLIVFLLFLLIFRMYHGKNK